MDDYHLAYRRVYKYADYVAINISSPNTPGLRELQFGEELNELLSTLKNEQTKRVSNGEPYVPLAVKIAPYLNMAEINELAETFLQFNIDCVIATNTTNDRLGLKDTRLAAEQGGLSGRPLLEKSDRVLQQLSSKLQGRIPIIAVGGIMTPQDARRKINLGASLVQIYTGFIYQGPRLVRSCVESIAKI